MKTRAITRSRRVPHTVDGITRYVTEPYTVHVPVPPRDWDRAVLGAVTVVVALAVTASVVWSTASIGDLLARAVPAGPAYGAAVVFDAAWITCLAIEWLARYDPARARLPRRAGHVALGAAMAAVAVHGWLVDQLAVGLVGAAVSGIAKGVWTVLLRHHAMPLDARTEQWLLQERAEVGGQLAMVAIRRRLQRARGQIAGEAAALAAGADTRPGPDPDADADPDVDPDTDPDTVRPLRPSVREAVRTAYASGLEDPARVLAYVHKVADPDARPDTVDRYLRSIRRSAS